VLICDSFNEPQQNDKHFARSVFVTTANKPRMNNKNERAGLRVAKRANLYTMVICINRDKWVPVRDKWVPVRDKWVPVTTAWRVLRLRMEERPAVMEGSCEYIE
jgi:hypothetical protein